MSDPAGGLQLLPDTKKRIDFSMPGQNTLLVFAFIFLAVIMASYSGLLYYQQTVLTKIAEVNTQIDQVERSRNKPDEQKLLKLKNDLAVIQPLLENHIFWSAAFERIQKLINPEVQFDSLTVKLDTNAYDFKAVAANYTTVAKQIAAFYADDTITDVLVGKMAGLPTGRVEFNVQLILASDKLLRSNKK